MKTKIAAIVNCKKEAINIKATTEEKLGFSGAKKGVSAHAIVLLSKNKKSFFSKLLQY